MSWSLMKDQMMRVISSPSSSTTGFFTVILAMGPRLYDAGPAHGVAPQRRRGFRGSGRSRASLAFFSSGVILRTVSEPSLICCWMRSSLAWRFSSALSRGVFGGMNTSLFPGAAGPNRGWLPKEMNRDSLLGVAYRATVRTEARRAEVRARIVHAALDLVRRGGYREASVAAVAQGAGVATGTVYRY